MTPEVEIRAILPDGRDIAAALQQIGGVALAMRSGIFFPFDDADLDPEVRRRLTELGAIEALEGRGFRLPWTIRITFHWMQTFAPGVTVVEHSYRPIVGFRLLTVDDKDAIVASGQDDPASVFCVDAAGKWSLRELSQPARGRRLKAGEGDNSYLFGYTLGYVLQTARNWRGPIGTFHLTIKGDALPQNDMMASKPIVAVHLCSQLPLNGTGPVRRDGEARDFMPDADLRILFVRNRGRIEWPRVNRSRWSSARRRSGRRTAAILGLRTARRWTIAICRSASAGASAARSRRSSRRKASSSP